MAEKASVAKPDINSGQVKADIEEKNIITTREPKSIIKASVLFFLQKE